MRPLKDEAYPIMCLITQNINYRMNELDMIPAELALLTGIDKGMVSRWLHGKAAPGWVAVLRLARALQVKPSYFLNTPRENRPGTKP